MRIARRKRASQGKRKAKVSDETKNDNNAKSRPEFQQHAFYLQSRTTLPTAKQNGNSPFVDESLHQVSKFALENESTNQQTLTLIMRIKRRHSQSFFMRFRGNIQLRMQSSFFNHSKQTWRILCTKT